MNDACCSLHRSQTNLKHFCRRLSYLQVFGLSANIRIQKFGLKLPVWGTVIQGQIEILSTCNLSLTF